MTGARSKAEVAGNDRVLARQIGIVMTEILKKHTTKRGYAGGTGLM